MQKTFWQSLGFKALILIVLGLSLAAGVVLPQWLIIKTVNVDGEANNVFIRPLANSSLLLLNAQSLAAEILAANPRVASVTVVKQYPQTLNISYTLEQPVAQLINGANYLLLNPQGKVIAQKSQRAALPLITHYQAIRYYESRPGQLLTNPDIRYALNLVQRAPQFNLSYERIEVSKPNQIRLITKRTLIYLNAKKPIDKNLQIVQNILRVLNRKGEVPRELNLFFDKISYTL